jgi:hypothetical protein
LADTLEHIAASLSWSDNGWTGPASQACLRASGHKNVREGWVGNESWNFNRAKNLRAGFKYGSFENAEQMRRFQSGRSLVFFCARDARAGQTLWVGLWAMAQQVQPVAIDDADHVQNIRVPSDLPGLIQPFARPFAYQPSRHLLTVDGGHRKAVGQKGFCYISGRGAAHILHDALERGNAGARTILDLYGW